MASSFSLFHRRVKSLQSQTKLSIITLYQYKPLPEGRFIRLLELKPGDYDDPILFDLRIVEHKNAPAYEAISYAWGDPKITTRVQCQGRTIKITKNLCRGLRRMRYKDKPRTLWADAVCIDQSNLAERGHQVAFMGDIYQQAETVLMWLGEASEPGVDEQCASLIRDADVIYTSLFNANGYSNFIKTRSSKDEITVDEYNLLQDARWMAFMTMINSPYFKRLWILQEVGFAESAIVMYGAISTAFSKMMSLAVTVDQRSSHSFLADHAPEISQAQSQCYVLSQAFQDVWTAFRAQNKWIEESPILSNIRYAVLHGTEDKHLLLWLLNLGRSKNASDPRDYIYALLGHPAARVQRAYEPCTIVAPDYTLSTQAVFKALTLQFTRLYDSLEVLCTVWHESTADLQCSPSWVTQWNKDPKTAQLNRYAGAPQLVWGKDPAVMKVQCQGNSLATVGIVFDSVTTCSRSFEYNDRRRLVTTSARGASTRKRVNPMHECWSVIEEHAVSSRTNDSFLAKQMLETMFAGLNQVSLSDAKAYHLQTSKEDECPALLVAIGEAANEGNARKFEHDLAFLWNRRFVMTSNDRMGLAPQIARPGDRCCVIFGCSRPLIIRPVDGAENHYRLVGECYVHGAMNREILDEWYADGGDASSNGRHKRQDIILV